MNAQLIELCERLRLNGRRAETLVSRAGAERLALRPRPDSWSAAECLVHLTLSTEKFLPGWRAVFAQSRGFTGEGPFKMDLVGRMFNWVLEPPAKFRVKAPAGLRPVASVEALAGFLAAQEQLLEVVSSAAGLALDRIKVPSPADSRVKYNAWSSFQITDTHQRRHLLQAERAAGLSE